MNRHDACWHEAFRTESCLWTLNSRAVFTLGNGLRWWEADIDNQASRLDKLIMRIASTILTFSLLIAVTPVAARNTLPPKLEDMDYDKARAVIVGYGWKPYPGECSGVSDETCKQYPEIKSCQGVAPGYCAMTFERKGNCLSVLTTEVPPGPDKDTFVKSLNFHARCFRDRSTTVDGRQPP